MIPELIQEVIAKESPDKQEILKKVYHCLAQTLPDAQLKISYGMPTFWQGRNIIHFAAQKKHLGIYPGSEPIVTFAEQLDQLGLTYSKGAIQFPYDRDIPYDLIRQIAEEAYRIHHK